LGAQGWVAVCSNFLPRDSARLFELVADHKDQVNALALYRRMLPLVKMVGGHRYVSASKVALDYMGLPVGIPRAPRLPLPALDTAELKAHLDRLQLKNSISLS
jgi:4-hydroxy-tetrahydrodipicolinate synthase